MANTTTPRIIDYYNSLRKKEDDPVFELCYDIYPEHQRDDVQDDAWRSKVISHLIIFGQLNPIVYHKVVRGDVTYYESLDGKQRSLAIKKLLDDEFRFVAQHENSEMLRECNHKYFSQWPLKYQTKFKTISIPVTLYDYEMDEDSKSLFFNNLQYTKKTKVGEVLNAYGNTNIMQIIKKRIVQKINLKHIWKNEPARGVHWHIFACMAYYIFKDSETIRDVSADTLIQWVSKEGNDKFDPERVEYLVQAVERVVQLMVYMDVKRRCDRNTLMGFFLLVVRGTPDDVFRRIIETYGRTREFNWPNITGKSDQGWRRYIYLRDVYGQ